MPDLVVLDLLDQQVLLRDMLGQLAILVQEVLMEYMLEEDIPDQLDT